MTALLAPDALHGYAMASDSQQLGATRIAHGALGPIEGLADDDVVFGRYLREGRYAPELLELLCALLTRGLRAGTLLDVGAHIGLVSIGVAQRTAARALAFEPAPANAALLRRNVAQHGLGERIEVHACALDSEPGKVLLALSDHNSGDHHLRSAALAPTHEPNAGVWVKARSLDELLDGRALDRPLVLKLDTQGSEARVLRGARATLERVEHAVVEYWPYGQHRMGEPAFALDALLSASFPFAAVIERGSVPARLQETRAELERLRWIARDGSDRGFFDLLLSRSATPLAGR